MTNSPEANLNAWLPLGWSGNRKVQGKMPEMHTKLCQQRSTI